MGHLFLMPKMLIACATIHLNSILHSLFDDWFPLKTVTLSTRDPPWVTPLVKFLIKKRSRAATSGNTSKIKEFSTKISKLIAENREKQREIGKIWCFRLSALVA